MHVDGLSNLAGSGAMLILASPKGNSIEYALCLEFLTINNKAKYEAHTIGLKMAKELGCGA